MTRIEFLAWVDFYELHPFDDFHRFYKPAALIATSLGGGTIEERLNWLEKPPALVDETGQYSEADLSFFKTFGIKPPVKPKG